MEDDARTIFQAIINFRAEAGKRGMSDGPLIHNQRAISAKQCRVQPRLHP